MLKPGQLRDHLTAATPDLIENPDKLKVFVDAGNLVCMAVGSLSFEYRYTLKLIVLDYRGDPNLIMVPLLAWISRHQLELLENPAQREKGIRFEVELLSLNTYDLTIEVDLTERVRVQPGGEPGSLPTTTRYDITPLGEPARVGLIAEPEHWELWAGGEKVADWHMPAAQDGV